MKTGAELEIERKNNEWSKKVDGKYKSSSSITDSSYQSGKNYENFGEAYNDIMGFSKEEIRLKQEKKEEQKLEDKKIKNQKNQKEANTKNEEYDKAYKGNIFKLNDDYVTEETRKVQNSNTVENKIFLYKGGAVNESIINTHYKYEITKKEFTITEHRSMSFPNKFKPYFEDITLTMIPQDQNGESVDENLAYFKVTYSKSGELSNMKISHKPYVSEKVSSSPVLIVVDNYLCTLTVTSGHFKHLSSIIEKNGGKVEYPNTELPEIVELTGDSNCTIF